MSTPDEAPITYIDADGTPLPVPHNLSADQDGAGVYPPLYVHLGDTGTGSTSVAELFEPAWRTTVVWAVVAFVAGALMVALSSGLAAIVLWPLGIFAMIAAGGALWVTMTARRLMSGDLSSHP